MLSYLNAIQDWIGLEMESNTKITEIAISCLQDFYFNPSVIQYEPEKVATAAVILAFQLNGVQIFEDEKIWYSVFSETSHEEIWEIIDGILKVYEIDQEN